MGETRGALEREWSNREGVRGSAGDQRQLPATWIELGLSGSSSDDQTNAVWRASAASQPEFMPSRAISSAPGNTASLKFVPIAADDRRGILVDVVVAAIAASVAKRNRRGFGSLPRVLGRSTSVGSTPSGSRWSWSTWVGSSLIALGQPGSGRGRGSLGLLAGYPNGTYTYSKEIPDRLTSSWHSILNAYLRPRKLKESKGPMRTPSPLIRMTRRAGLHAVRRMQSR